MVTVREPPVIAATLLTAAGKCGAVVSHGNPVECSSANCNTCALDTEQWVQAYWTNTAKVNLSCPRLKQLFYININWEAMDGIPSF